MPYVKYALTKTIGKKRVFNSDMSLDKIMGCQSPNAVPMQLWNGLKKKKLNIAKLKLRRERILASQSQRNENTNQYTCNKNNTEHDEEYS